MSISQKLFKHPDGFINLDEPRIYLYEIYVLFVPLPYVTSEKVFIFKVEPEDTPPETENFLRNGWATYHTDGLKNKGTFNSYNYVYALACPLC